MRAIRTYCCCCDALLDVFHIEGNGNIDCIGDRCDSCTEKQKTKVKKTWKKPQLGVVVNDSKDFDKMMNDRKVNNQPKKRAKR